ncbi:MAG: hypothetical protein JO345_19305 [Streptosporangiaceae bacterium]|nr:hypothetical protein [Streptosporangiaceae bacterium]
MTASPLLTTSCSRRRGYLTLYNSANVVRCWTRTEGQQVSAGDTVVVLEAMKMEQPLAAHKGGTVTGLSVTVGQTVTSGVPICQIEG